MKRSRNSAERDVHDSELIPRGRGRALPIGGQLDVARCPLCDGPMTPRLNRHWVLFLLLLPCPAQRRGATRGEENRQPVACP